METGSAFNFRPDLLRAGNFMAGVIKINQLDM